jgi:transposase
LAEVVFVLGAKRVPVPDQAAQLVQGWSRERTLRLEALRRAISNARRLHDEVVLIDELREELFSILVEMERQHPLEDGLPALKAAASEPIVTPG